jgi:hypothetical protein
MREIRFLLRDVKELEKLTKTEIFNHIKAIYKVSFKGQYKDVYPTLSKTQRLIMDSLTCDIEK